ncbi:MAG: pteridine reductase [Candidatus Methylophosphatis roskildensis]
MGTSESILGKSVLVTGGARRVGAEIVRTLHAAGASVSIHYRRSEREASALADSLNTQRAESAQIVHADLADADGFRGLVAEVVDRFGRLDGLVNNASSFFSTPMGRISDADWSELIGSNLKAPLFLSQAAAPYLRVTRGAVVNITDIHGERPLAGFSVYCAAKAGLAGLTRALAIELAPEVRVNGVAPGPIEWPEDETFDIKTRQEIIDHTLLKRTGTPADVARSVLFLLAGAQYVTGQILAVDGGRSAHL